MSIILRELLPLLDKSNEIEIRKRGLNIIISQISTILECSDDDWGDFFDSMMSILSSPKLLLLGLSTLVNVFAEKISLVDLLSESQFEGLIKKCKSCLERKKENVVNVTLMLLSNMTTSDLKSRAFFRAVETSPGDTTFLQYLLECFLLYNPQVEQEFLTKEDWENFDPWQHAASVLCNISRLEEGQRYILIYSIY